MSSYQNKTKKELITALEKLIKLNNTLMFSASKDQKEYNLAEQNNIEKGHQFRKLSANVPDLIFQFTRRVDGSYFVPIASEGIKNIFGCSPADVLNDFTPIAKVIYPEDSERVINAIEYSAKHLSYFTCEFRVQLPGKEIQWIYSKSTPEKLPDGSVTWYGFNANITEQKKVEELLANEKRRLSDILKGTNIGTWEWNIQTGETIYNKRWAEIIGYTLDEISPINIETWAKFAHPEDLKISNELLEKHFKSEIEYYECEGRMKHKNGNWIWVLDKGSVHSWDKDGNPLFMSGTHQDITERKELEQSLLSSKNYLDKIINSVASPIFVKDDKHRYCLVNDSLCSFLNLKRKDLIGKTGNEHFPNEQNKVFFAKDNEVLKTGKENINEEFITDGQGKIRTIITRKTLYTDAEGNKFLVGVINDITERKQSEAQIRKLSQAVEQSPVSIILTDTKGNIEYANPKTLEITGYKLKELKGKNPKIFSSSEKPKSEYNYLWKTILSGKEWRGEFHNKKKNGSLYWELASISPIINEKGEIINFLAVKEDITEHKQILNDLIVAKEHAEESDRLKSAFLANMSHEIRTPMNGILGFAGLLKEPGISGEKQQKYIKIIEKSGERMLNIINDIVDISKIESGLMKVYITEMDINDKIENLYNFFKPEAEAKNIQFSIVKTLPENEAFINTDSEKLYAILSNLLKNAIKFTNEGEIEFGVGYESDLSGKNHLKFLVKDTGIGIPKDRQNAIFERFIQADISDKMAIQGAGLGLSIAKAYTEMLGGKIWVESKEGIGSAFYFTIPYNKEREGIIIVQEDDESLKADKKIGNLKILIAEDDEASEIFLSMIVEEFASKIFIAKNGFEAVEICHNYKDIDLILMDIQMPNLNGYEATQQIRKFNKDVIIIAQTAYGFSADKEKAIKEGCNDYISKPINIDDLIALIQKYFN